MEGMNYCLLVTEPTPFGLHDLKLAASLAEKLKLSTGILINKSYGEDEIIESFAIKSSIPIIGKIPFNRKYAESYSKGEVLIEKHVELKEIFKNIYQSINRNGCIPKIISESESSNFTTHDFPIKSTVERSLPFKELVVISGKGGTGKTTITSSLSELIKNIVIADNDVDASNLHLLCHPQVIESGDFVGGEKYFIDETKCIGCGACKNLCQFNAIRINKTFTELKFTIDEMSCEGCGFCFNVCNSNAICKRDSILGKWYISKAEQGYFSHAKLGIGEENSGKLVSLVRDNARKLAEKSDSEYVLSDGPPGTGCPVISSITGVDLALIVTEPTISGVHDMKRALDLTKHFGVRTLIVVNKFDLNKDVTNQILSIAEKCNTKVIGKIPCDKSVNDSLMEGKSIVARGEGVAYKAILEFWEKLQMELK